MARKSELPKARYHLMLFREDVEFLEAEYGKGSPSPVGLSEAISRIVHAKVEDLRAKAAVEYERIARHGGR